MASSAAATRRLHLEDIFSDSYLDEFYKAHVASRRSSLDEDIAAIEAEINKVHQYRHKFRRYRVEEQQLNSCGNSECSDDEESRCDTSSGDMEMLPTSVFKIYNSTVPSPNSSPGNLLSNNNNIFSWAQYQVVSHDHNYSSPSGRELTLYLVQDSITLDHVQWNQLTVSKRSQALKRLASILRNKPSSSSPLLSPSLSLIPQSLADLLRSHGGVVTLSKANRPLDKDVVIKLSRDSLAQSLIPTAVSSPSVAASSKTRRRTRTAPYETKRPTHVEVTRVRYSSTCSENDSPLEVD